MARDNWLNKDKGYPYLSSATTTHKDEYFEVSISSFFLTRGGIVAYTDCALSRQ